MADAAEASGATLALFDSVLWRDIDEVNYFIARPALEADLVINLPKLKTHYLTLYTGAVKNVFGVVPGTRKREVHLRAPGMADFSRELVNLLEIVRPGLTIMDGIVGQEGRGPGTGGAPHAYGLLAASIDPVALDVVLSGAMGFTPGEIVHLKEAGERDLGVADPREIRVIGNPALLNFGRLRLPSSPWVRPHLPGWLGQPVEDMIRLQPRLRPEACDGCGKCIRVCPGSQVIEPGRPVQLHLEHCIGCMCCVDACPHGAIAATRGPAARLLGLGV
jgi:NAD-dependent dihydropyrimidine dehydrogenase PreA subunit